ncbi:hypothetical protein B0H14DRAFT_2574362 [Mycena olivaceomarginata]|nr:hypothetical protein B0H14DRAFT_2574362 [Mycena olivaceomarginata]
MKEKAKAGAEKESSPFKIVGQGGDPKINEAPQMIVNSPETAQQQRPARIEQEEASPKDMPPQRPVVARKPRKLKRDDQSSEEPRDEGAEPTSIQIPSKGTSRDKVPESIASRQALDTTRANSKGLSSGVQDLLELRNIVKVTTAYALRRDDPMIAATFVAQDYGFLTPTKPRQPH